MKRAIAQIACLLLCVSGAAHADRSRARSQGFLRGHSLMFGLDSEIGVPLGNYADASSVGGGLAVTGELTVRYVRPVPLETPLAGRAQLVADRERYADVEGRIEDLATAAVLATARGRFVFMRG